MGAPLSLTPPGLAGTVWENVLGGSICGLNILKWRCEEAVITLIVRCELQLSHLVTSSNRSSNIFKALSMIRSISGVEPVIGK